MSIYLYTESTVLKRVTHEPFYQTPFKKLYDHVTHLLGYNMLIDVINVDTVSGTQNVLIKALFIMCKGWCLLFVQ